MMQTKPTVSPSIFFISSIVFFCAYILASKSILLTLPILLFIFVRLVILALADLYLTQRQKHKRVWGNHLGLHLMMGFAYLGYQLCFFGAVTTLPLISVVAIYLSYTALIPWILRIWIGKRLFWPYILSSSLIFIGLICSFDAHLKLKSIFIVLAIAGMLFKAVYQTGYSRLEISNSPLYIWLFKYSVSLSCAALLLIGTSFVISWQQVLFILILVALEKTYKICIHKGRYNLKPIIFISLFNLNMFICGFLDFLIFKTIPSYLLILTAALIYCGIFLIFLQKSVSSNSLHDL